MENVAQDNLPSSKSKLKIFIATLAIVILLIGGYVITKNSQSVPQNILSKKGDCGTNLDCFIEAAQNCSSATVSKTESVYEGNFKKKMTYQIKGQESEKCILITTIEMEGYIDSIRAKEGKTTNKEMAKQKAAEISCEFDRNELVSAIQDLKIGGNTLNKKISTCKILSQNQSQR